MTIDSIIHETKDRLNSGFHEDHRRTISTAFNGDLDNFIARQAFYHKLCIEPGLSGNMPPKPQALATGNTNDSRQLLYLLSGYADVRIDSKNNYLMVAGDRLLVPKGLSYNIDAAKGSEFFLFGETMFDYENSENNILNLKNVEATFDAKQVKIASLKQDSLLGGHYHNYYEFFYLLDGEAVFNFQNIDDKDDNRTIIMGRGETLLVPPKMAHKASLNKGSILVGFTEEPYISPQHNDYKFDF